ncbi:MAG: NAD(+) diphosphatase [Alphaproteobacteria bacterium]
MYGFTGLDRASAMRKDEAWVAERLDDATSRFIPVWRSRNLVVAQPAPAAVYLSRTDHAELIEQAGDKVLLGLFEQTSYFAVDLSDHEEPLALPPLRPIAEAKAEFLDLRQVGALMDPKEASTLAYARGMLTWHRRHLFCGQCGAPTRAIEGGHVRKCTNDACDLMQFPRTDPAVIMLVTRGDNCLLGRQKVWPEGMYSTLAGFVEPGETLETAVAREVAEETGVGVKDVRYHSSQPWPFPTSLMLGYYATALSDALNVNTDELQDARWFSREWIRANEGSRDFRLPRKDSIARRLIEDWLSGAV